MSASMWVAFWASSSMAGSADGHAPERGGTFAAPSILPAGPSLRSIHPRTTGSAVTHMLRSGLRVRATPSTTTMVFCSSSKLRLGLHVELAGHLEQLGRAAAPWKFRWPAGP